MPKGAKKRKAEKKKKGQGSHGQNHDQQPQSENDDLKRHEGKESEGEEVSSPTSSHDLAIHQQEFTDEEKEETGGKNGSTHVHDVSVGSKSTEENNIVVLEDEESLKSDVEFDNNIVVQHVGSQEESGVGVLSETLSKESVVQIERESKLSEKLEEEESGGGGLLQGNDATQATNMLSEGLTHVPNLVSVGEIYESVIESGANTVSDNSGPVEKKTSMDSVTSGDSFLPFKQEIDGNGKCEKEKDEVVAKKDAVGVSFANNSTTQETREVFLSGINRGNATNGADFIKHSEVNKSPENQPLLGSAARLVQRTSWMSCCGLLDVLAGSAR